MHHMNNIQTNKEPLVTIQNHMQYSNNKKPDEHHMNPYAHSNTIQIQLIDVQCIACSASLLQSPVAMLPRTRGKASLSGSHGFLVMRFLYEFPMCSYDAHMKGPILFSAFSRRSYGIFVVDRMVYL